MTAKKKAVAKKVAKVVAKKATPRRPPAKKTLVPAKKRAVRTPNPPGRPSDYNDKTAQAVCEYVAQGFTLRQIAAEKGMPAKSTIIRWLATHEGFQDQYARAHEVLAMVMEDEILDIADDSRNDWVQREGKNGEMVFVLNDEAIARSRARIDARKWLMAKKAPKRYGDRVAVTGKDGGPLQHEHAALAELVDAVNGADVGIGRAQGRGGSGA